MKAKRLHAIQKTKNKQQQQRKNIYIYTSVAELRKKYFKK